MDDDSNDKYMLSDSPSDLDMNRDSPEFLHHAVFTPISDDSDRKGDFCGKKTSDLLKPKRISIQINSDKRSASLLKNTTKQKVDVKLPTISTISPKLLKSSSQKHFKEKASTSRLFQVSARGSMASKRDLKERDAAADWTK